MKDINASSRPIFIIGCPRSGTTLLRLMLDSHPNISCGPETSFLIDMQPILGSHWPHIKLYGFSKEYWHQKIAEFFSSFQMEYAQKRGKKRWAEKTPHYTPHLKFILDLFPDSQIVHIIRDGRDVVASHLKRWGYKEAIKSILRWQKYVTVGKSFGRNASEGTYYEIFYEDIVNDTEKTMHSLLQFLNEPWDDEVLEYLQMPHDVRPTYFEQIQDRQQKSGDLSLIYTSRVGMWRRELNPCIKLLFYFWAKGLLKELGYI